MLPWSTPISIWSKKMVLYLKTDKLEAELSQMEPQKNCSFKRKENKMMINCEIKTSPTLNRIWMFTALVSVYELSKKLNHRHREVCFNRPSIANDEDVGDDVAKNINKHDTAETLSYPSF